MIFSIERYYAEKYTVVEISFARAICLRRYDISSASQKHLTVVLTMAMSMVEGLRYSDEPFTLMNISMKLLVLKRIIF